jgi:hypothetical protein
MAILPSDKKKNGSGKRRIPETFASAGLRDQGVISFSVYIPCPSLSPVKGFLISFVTFRETAFRTD